MSKQPIVIEESVWMNSHLSIARHYGQVKINGNMYMLCNKSGITIFELSNPSSKYYVGDNNMAIPPGEPADLVRKDWIPIYKKLGRDRTIELVKNGIDLDEMKTRIVCFDFGRLMPMYAAKRYVIEYKPHWWSKWRIRDWYDKTYNIPMFYESIEQAKKHL